MNKKAIWAIVVLMSTAMIGLAALQFIWINWQLKLGEQQFEDKVYTALGEVKKKLDYDAEQDIQGVLRHTNKKGLFTSKSKEIVSNFMNKKANRSDGTLKLYELKSIPYLLDPETKLEEINIEKLADYLKTALESKGVKLPFDHGVYSENSNSFIAINKNYVVDVEGDFSEVEEKETRELKDTKFYLPLFDSESQSPGSLKVFFPSYNNYLLSSILIPLIASLLFTGLIIFCFIYVVYVIFRQKKVSEMKTDFINNMTHEFKTPIATISLASDSINSPSIINNEEKIRRFTGIIKQENTRMLNQVEKVLQMATIDKKDFDLNVTKVNLHDIINQAIENASLKVQKRGGVIESKLIAKNVIVLGDRIHISNIIHNLLDNAEKYSAENPKIMITTKNVRDGVEVSISDNGIGMKKETLKYIFDKFYRVHTGNLHNVKGFGLGLSYVKALMDSHKGTINVKSELGEGSTFILFFMHEWSDK